jgi:PAS domain S-box-containing protein
MDMGDVKNKGNKKRRSEGALNRSRLQNLRLDVSPFLIIAVTTLVTIAISIYFLSAGYFNIFPNLFYIPIIIACIYYKKRGLMFSITVACIYFLLTLVFTRESSLLLEAFVMVLIFVFVAGIVSYLSSVRKRAGEALQKSEERFRQMVDLLPEAVCEFDASGNILFGNRAAFIMVGYDEADFEKGLNILPMIAPEDQERAFINIQKMMAGEALGADEYMLVSKDGSRFPATVHIANILNASGKTIGFRGIIVDITERKRAERYQELAAEILGILSESIALTDAVGRILAAIKRGTGIDAVGIRLRKDDDFPYFIQSGFSQDFLLTENTLVARSPDGGPCRDTNGNVSLECTCGLVLSGKTDPSNPLFTPGGSAWTNDSLSLLDIPLDQDTRLHPRNRCIHAGFQSVALIPIRANNEIVGLLQLNDCRKGSFTLETIRFFERIAESVGVALMRKQMEEAQQRLSAIVASSHDAIIGKTLDGIITSWNKGAEERYGYSVAEVVGRPISILIPPERADEMPRFLAQVGRGEAVIDYESERITKDGWRVTVLLTISPIKDASGDVVGASTIAQDITERKRMEKALLESEQKYRSLYVDSRDAVMIASPDEGFLAGNPATIEMFGCRDEQDFMARTPASLSPEYQPDGSRSLDKSQEMMRIAMEKGSHSFEWMHRRVDGADFLATVLLSRLESGGKRLLQATVRDITEHKRFEEMLRESEQKFRELADLLPQTVCEINLNGRFTYTNRYGIEAHGYTKEEIEKSLNALDLFIPAQRDRVVQNISRVLSGQPFDDHEYSVLRKDGSTYPAIIYTNAIVRDGKVVGVRALVVDITERKKVEQMKTDFVSFISHQLRTPVAGLMGYIDNMLDGIMGDLNSKQIEYLSEMRGVCERNSRLIADLLNVSRIERGVLTVNISPVALRSVVDSAVKEHRKSIEEKGLVLSIKEADQGIVVLADTDKLVEVLKNVIHNAAKFTSKGSISIEIVAEGQDGIVKVRDTGMGMSKEALQDLFKKEKVMSGAAVVGGGAGLGLYIAKGFMQLQHGDITAESVESKGSTFIVRLPKK